MTRTWLFLIPVAIGVAPAAAQLTPEQRQQREWAAVQNTIGRTREIEAYDRALNDPLRGLRCPGDASSYYPCISTSRDYRLGTVRSRGGSLGAPGGRIDPQEAQSFTGGTGAPRPSQAAFGALGAAGVAPRRLHVLGTEAFDLPAGQTSILTLASAIGSTGRPLMIRTVVGAAEGTPDWTRMAEEVGDSAGRYLVAVPTFPAGRYWLQVEIYDVDHPETPFSSSTVPLLVR